MTEYERIALWQFAVIQELSDSAALVRNLNSGQLMIRHLSPAENLPVMLEIMQIGHPNLMRVYDAVITGKACTSLCEYVDGMTLEESVERFRPYDETAAKQIMIQICEGLSALHARGIIHRDVNPSNVMIGRDGTVRIIDYDITRIEKAGAGRDTRILGTQGYAPPEQFGFSQTDERSDIYSCGVLLNYLLTGRRPDEMLYSGGLNRVILGCIQIDSEKRYDSAAQLAQALKSGRYEKPAARPVRKKRIFFKIVSALLFAVYLLFFYLYLNSWRTNPKYTASAESIKRYIVMGVDLFGLWTILPYIFFFNAFGLSYRLRPKDPAGGRAITVFLGIACLVGGAALLGI